MIKPCYLFGCVAALQVCRLTFWSASSNVGNSNNAWNVNFNNGNVNNNNRNNTNYVRLVRAGEWSVVRIQNPPQSPFDKGGSRLNFQMDFVW